MSQWYCAIPGKTTSLAFHGWHLVFSSLEVVPFPEARMGVMFLTGASQMHTESFWLTIGLSLAPSQKAGVGRPQRRAAVLKARAVIAGAEHSVLVH